MVLARGSSRRSILPSTLRLLYPCSISEFVPFLCLVSFKTIQNSSKGLEPIQRSNLIDDRRLDCKVMVSSGLQKSATRIPVSQLIPRIIAFSKIP